MSNSNPTDRPQASTGAGEATSAGEMRTPVDNQDPPVGARHDEEGRDQTHTDTATEQEQIGGTTRKQRPTADATQADRRRN